MKEHRKKLSDFEKKKIIALYKENKTITDISSLLNRSKSVVSRIVKVYSLTGSPFSGKKPGRPRKTSKRTDRKIQRISLRDRFKTANQISREINEETQVSRQTVSRRLNEIGLFARIPRKKPLI